MPDSEISRCPELALPLLGYPSAVRVLDRHTKRALPPRFTIHAQLVLEVERVR